MLMNNSIYSIHLWTLQCFIETVINYIAKILYLVDYLSLS
jgi:hypothetical protein